MPGPVLGVRAGPHPWENHLFELLGARQQSVPPTEPGEPRNWMRFNTIPPDRGEETNRVYNVGKKRKCSNRRPKPGTVLETEYHAPKHSDIGRTEGVGMELKHRSTDNQPKIKPHTKRQSYRWERIKKLDASFKYLK